MRTILAVLALSACGFAQVTPPPSGGGGVGGPTQVSKLPASAPTNQPYIVTDGTGATDCSVGGGSDQVLCAYTGSSWIATPSTVSGSSGANTSLSNLGTTSLNAALLFQTGLDVGSTTKPARNLYLYGSGTYGTNYFELTGTPSNARTVTLADANSNTVVPLTCTNQVMTALSAAGVLTCSTVTYLGTVTSGTWNASAIGAGYGGTGQNTSSSSGVAQVSGGTWSISTALASGTTATTQSSCDNSTKVATTAYTGITCETIETSATYSPPPRAK